MSTWNSSVSIGTITTPPPSPVSEPRKPASSEPMPTSSVNSSVFKRCSGCANQFNRSEQSSWQLMRLRFFETVEKKIIQIGLTSSGEQLENSRCAHSASHAHRHHAVAARAALQVADDCGGKFRAGASQWMSQRDRATVWIQTCRIQPRLLNYRQRLRGESF